jgi:Tol biopolymer transport system component
LTGTAVLVLAGCGQGSGEPGATGSPTPTVSPSGGPSANPAGTGKPDDLGEDPPAPTPATLETSRVDVTPAPAGATGLALSGDGNHLAYLVQAPLSGHYRARLFVKDLTTARVRKVCVGPGGVAANKDCLAPQLSSDGHYVAFSTRADNLLEGDTNKKVDVFVRDLTAGTTTRVTRADGSQGDRSAYLTSISADGNKVAFVSVGSFDADHPVTALTEHSAGHVVYCYVKDLRGGKVTLLRGSAGDACQDTTGALLSPDGNTVAFANRSVDPNSDDPPQVQITDLRAGTTQGLTDRLRFELPEHNEVARFSAPSADGARIAFTVNKPSLGEDEETLPEREDATGLYVADLRSNKIIHTVGTSQGDPDRTASGPALSADGTYLVFSSTARGTAGLFRTDLDSGKIRRVVSMGPAGSGLRAGGVSDDGAAIALEYGAGGSRADVARLRD